MSAAAGTAQPRVLLLVPARTYRAADFLIAAGLAGPRPGYWQRRRAARRWPPGRARQPQQPGRQCRPDHGPGNVVRRGRGGGHPDAGAGRPGGRAARAARQPRGSRGRRHRQGRPAAPVGSSGRGPAGVPGRAARRYRGFPAAGGGPSGIPVRGQGGIAQRQPGRPAGRRSSRCGGGGPAHPADPGRGRLVRGTSRCSSRST